MTQPGTAPGMFRRVFVDDSPGLRDVAAELATFEVLGVDLEMAQRLERRPGGIQEWRHLLALIQIAGGDLSVVVDPLRCRDLSPLRPLMAGPSRKVFLGGGQDAALLERTGIPAHNVADVGEVALALFGRREDGMAALAHRIFGISLDKTVRRADWLARPLNPVLLSYAHRDAELTLLIYYWFRDHHPRVLRFHERRELEPPLIAGSPAWLQEASRRTSQDPRIVIMESGLDPASDEVAEAVRAALAASPAPRLSNRLLRLAAELGLTGLLPDVVPFLSSPSSMLRATAARAVLQLAEADAGIPLVTPLLEDPIEEVRNTAQTVIRELKVPRSTAPAAEESEEPPVSLDEGSLAALEELRSRLQSAE